jgi:hypothetical protein
MGAENLAPTGFRSPDRPARTEPLYLLSYAGPHFAVYNAIFIYGLLKPLKLVTNICTAAVDTEMSLYLPTVCLGVSFESHGNAPPPNIADRPL